MGALEDRVIALGDVDTEAAEEAEVSIQDVETMNKRVACTPFERTSIEVANTRGFAVVKQKQGLSQLEVVFESEDGFHPGNKVAVFGSSCAAAWAKEVFEIGGKKFVLVPVGEIVAVIR